MDKKWTWRMLQLSLFDNGFPLAGVLPAIRASMRRLAGEDGECRKRLVDKINSIATLSQYLGSRYLRMAWMLKTARRIQDESNTDADFRLVGRHRAGSEE